MNWADIVHLYCKAWNSFSTDVAQTNINQTGNCKQLVESEGKGWYEARSDTQLARMKQKQETAKHTS